MLPKMCGFFATYSLPIHSNLDNSILSIWYKTGFVYFAHKQSFFSFEKNKIKVYFPSTEKKSIDNFQDGVFIHVIKKGYVDENGLKL